MPALAQQMIAIWAVLFANVFYKFPKNNIKHVVLLKTFLLKTVQFLIVYFYLKLSFVCIYKLTENIGKKIDVIYNIIWKVLV